jgi:hypothetical protein
MDDFPWMGLVESYIGLQMDDFHWMGLVESAIHLLVCPAKSIQVIINKPKDHRLIKMHSQATTKPKSRLRHSTRST